jgi:hypothetical protein
MIRFYRFMLPATVLAGLATPAFAQTPAPAAPDTTAPAQTAAPDAAPADTKTDAKPAKPAVHKHHHVAAKKKPVATEEGK